MDVPEAQSKQPIRYSRLTKREALAQLDRFLAPNQRHLVVDYDAEQKRASSVSAKRESDGADLSDAKRITIADPRNRANFPLSMELAQKIIDTGGMCFEDLFTSKQLIYILDEAEVQAEERKQTAYMPASVAWSTYLTLHEKLNEHALNAEEGAFFDAKFVGDVTGEHHELDDVTLDETLSQLYGLVTRTLAGYFNVSKCTLERCVLWGARVALLDFATVWEVCEKRFYVVSSKEAWVPTQLWNKVSAFLKGNTAKTYCVALVGFLQVVMERAGNPACAAWIDRIDSVVRDQRRSFELFYKDGAIPYEVLAKDCTRLEDELRDGIFGFHKRAAYPGRIFSTYEFVNASQWLRRRSTDVTE